MAAQLSSSSILAWLVYLAVAVGITAVIETFFRESLPHWGFHTEFRIWAYIIEFAFLSSLATAPLLDKAHWLTAILFYTLPVVGVLIYFVPTAIAIERSSQRIELIFFVNLLAGWTVAGWFWTLAESFRDARREQTQIVAERLAPRPPQRGPFITPDTFTREPLRYLVGKGPEQPAEAAPPMADQPSRPELAQAQPERRPTVTIFGRPAARTEAVVSQNSASAAKTVVTTN
jgi:hypothetical protein